jgi:hypothetical protein
MVTILALPHIICGTQENGWNMISKITGIISCISVDAIYVVPLIFM